MVEDVQYFKLGKIKKKHVPFLLQENYRTLGTHSQNGQSISLGLHREEQFLNISHVTEIKNSIDLRTTST